MTFLQGIFADLFELLTFQYERDNSPRRHHSWPLCSDAYKKSGPVPTRSNDPLDGVSTPCQRACSAS
jgi:hypothetical protein